MSLTEIAALVAAAGAIVGWVITWRKTRHEQESSAIGAVSGLLSDITRLREEVEAARDSEDDCRDRLSAAKESLREALAQLGDANERLKLELSIRPLVIAAAKARRLADDTRRVYNACRDGIVVSDPRVAGRFVFVNHAFARALGRTPEEIITNGYAALIHPDDAVIAEAVDTDAWHGGGEVKNRYLHADGSWITLQWHFTTFDDGASFCIVWFERRRTDATNLRTLPVPPHV